MVTTLRELMTPTPVAMPRSTTLVDAAERMRAEDIGDVIVLDGDRACGLITDRDIVVRAVAAGRDPSATTLGEICHEDLVALSPDEPVEAAVTAMRERAIRRIPVVEDGRLVGIVSLGDLAVERDPKSALADISAAPSNSQ